MRKILVIFILTMGVLPAGMSADARQSQPSTQTDKPAAVVTAEAHARAERGDADAQFTLGWMYDEGLRVPKDDAQAVAWYRKAAEQGDEYAQYNLGSKYFKGAGVPQDPAQAVEWWRKAAEQGNVRAQYALGLMYINGRGVPQDYAQAAVLFRNAADQGYADAQFRLADMYDAGQGVPKDDVAAVFWFRKAAEQGSAPAQSLLGLAYATGHAVPQDYAQAVVWYRKAALQGFPLAQASLAESYYNGRGVPQDYAQAAIWYRRAAEQGHADGQAKLAVLYTLGQGVAQDYVEGHMWFNLATAQSTGEEQKNLAAARDELAAKMTPDQLAEAQRRARAWTPAAPSGTSIETRAPSTIPAPEEAVNWRRAAPTRTAILLLKPEDRNPSPEPNIFERSAAAVVGVSGPQGKGSAFLITRDGLALTNHHVVDRQGTMKATLRDGRRLAVRVLRSNPEADVALIQINCAADCFTLAPARSNPSIGSEVHVIGNALALDYTLTQGVVSGLRLAGGVTLVQTDAALNPGNSGGPIIDAQTRRVLAIVSWKVTAEGAEGVGFGVAIADALRVLGIQWQ
jgi:uncharacterized protein